MEALNTDELEAERGYLRRAADALDQTRRLLAERAGREAETQAAMSGRIDRDVQVATAFGRLRMLESASGQLCFGRLTLDDGEVRYIGRQGISAIDGEVLVVDWRAPASTPFYRATPTVPLGVKVRRHFRYRGAELVGLDDQLFGLDAPADASGLVGEAALLAALESPHRGRMAPIVATIQAEQDEVIRAPLGGLLVVAGGPGTGKTVVALHRAAFLLFTHPLLLRNQGMLVVGPSRTFLRYVEQVLPDLGEHAVTLATIDELAGFGPATAADSSDAAALKGGSEMAALLARAVRCFQRSGSRDLRVPVGRLDLALPRPDISRAVRRARAGAPDHAAGRIVFERLLAGAFAQRYRERVAADPRGGRPLTLASATEAVRSAPAFQAALNRLWPRLEPEQLLEDLLRRPDLLALAARDLLDEDQQAVLRREPGTGWSSADLALLDELRALIGEETTAAVPTKTSALTETALRAVNDAVPLPDCRRCGSEVTPLLTTAGRVRRWQCDACDAAFPAEALISPEKLNLLEAVIAGIIAAESDGAQMVVEATTWGHAIVDEAQDLSPMQWRVLRRRCPSLSMTIVGDPNQALGMASAGEWDPIVAAISPTHVARHTLTVNYRTPAPVMALAQRLVGGVSATSIRDGVEPRFVEAAWAQYPTHVLDVLRDRAGRGGNVCVICPPADLDRLRAALGITDVDDPTQEVLVLTATQAKGLEFDLVIVVDATAIAAQEHGNRQLYVALTRATRQLVLVGPAPADLRNALPEPTAVGG